MIKSAKEVFVLYSPRRVVVSLLTRLGASLLFMTPPSPQKSIIKKKKHLGRAQKDAIQQRERKKKAKLGFTEACRGRLTRAHGGSDGAVSRRVRASSLPMKEVEIGVALAKKSPGSFIF